MEDPTGKYNKRGPKLWTTIKNAAFLLTLLLFLTSAILMLDAYKYISIRHAKFARKKLLTALQYMDRDLIESHSGFKVLSGEEYAALQSELSEVRGKIREANSELQEKYSEVLKVSVEVQGVKKDMEGLKKMQEEADAAAAEAKTDAVAGSEVEEKATADTAVGADAEA